MKLIVKVIHKTVCVNDKWRACDKYNFEGDVWVKRQVGMINKTVKVNDEYKC